MKTRTVLTVLSVLFVVATTAVTVVVTLGATRPVEHEVVASRTVGVGCGDAWETLADIEGQYEWRADLSDVRRLPDRLGRTAWMEYYSHGERMVVSEVTLTPPTRLVLRLDDNTGPFDADWVFELSDVGAGCEVTLTEYGRSNNPMFRFVLHYLVGISAYPELYLSELKAHLG